MLATTGSTTRSKTNPGSISSDGALRIVAAERRSIKGPTRSCIADLWSMSSHGSDQQQPRSGVATPPLLRKRHGGAAQWHACPVRAVPLSPIRPRSPDRFRRGELFCPQESNRPPGPARPGPGPTGRARRFQIPPLRPAKSGRSRGSRAGSQAGRIPSESGFLPADFETASLKQFCCPPRLPLFSPLSSSVPPCPKFRPTQSSPYPPYPGTTLPPPSPLPSLQSPALASPVPAAVPHPPLLGLSRPPRATGGQHQWPQGLHPMGRTDRATLLGALGDPER